MSTSAISMNTHTCGTCSICSGPVTVPNVWYGVIPPTPTCQRCGAIPVESHGPVIPMQPGPRWITTTTLYVTSNASDFQTWYDQIYIPGTGN